MEEKKKHLSIFSFKVILFLALLSGIIYLLSDFVPINRSEMIDNSFYHLQRTKDSVNYDIIFCSNSFIYTSIDPLYFNYLTHINGIQISSGAERIVFTIETIKYVLRHYKPKCIVMDLSINSTYLPDNERSWSFNTEALLSSGVSFSKLKKIITLTPENKLTNVFFNGFSTFTATLIHLNNWENYHKTARYSKPTGYLGFYTLLEQKEDIKEMSIEKFNKLYNDTNKSERLFFDEESKTEFFNFLNEFSDKNIKLIFLSSVKLNSSSESGFDTIAEKIREISPENYFTINLNDADTKRMLGLNKDDFSDPIHLTHSGALKVTGYVAPMIKNIVKKDSDDFNNSKNSLQFNNGLTLSGYNFIIEDYFHKTFQLYLDSIPSDYNDSSLIISVFPKPAYYSLSSNKLNDEELKSDNFYLNRTDFNYTNDEQIVATVSLKTKLKKEQIGRIEISFVESKNGSTESLMIYQSKL